MRREKKTRFEFIFLISFNSNIKLVNYFVVIVGLFFFFLCISFRYFRDILLGRRFRTPTRFLFPYALSLSLSPFFLFLAFSFFFSFFFFFLFLSPFSSWSTWSSFPC